jgi:predicted RNase H-like HicB family nuclease
MRFKLTEEVWKEGNMYVSYFPELDIASCGETVYQAKRNLKEVILIYLEEAQRLGTLDQILEESGFDELQGIFFSEKNWWGLLPLKFPYDGGDQANHFSGPSKNL